MTLENLIGRYAIEAAPLTEPYPIKPIIPVFIPMRERNVKIISEDPRFSTTHLHTHVVAHYTREYLAPVLTTDEYNPFDELIIAIDYNPTED
jgi:hypothetical protein